MERGQPLTFGVFIGRGQRVRGLGASQAQGLGAEAHLEGVLSWNEKRDIQICAKKGLIYIKCAFKIFSNLEN